MKRIIVKNVSKQFRIGFKKQQSTLARLFLLFSGKEQKKTIEAIKNISFEVNSGEVLGIIGSNGSGKSTLLRIIAGIYKQNSGEISLNGRVASFIGLCGALKQRLTMRENIFLVGSFFRMSQKEIKHKFDSIVKFSELQDFTNTKIYQFSEGMKTRLAFSIAAHCNPEILLLDEVFEVGDEEFRKKSGRKIRDMIKSGASAILVSHSMDNIEKNCSRTILLRHGEIAEFGESKKVIAKYLSS